MNETFTKSKISKLELVYPPISNQEAVWLQNDPEVVELFRNSDFYMIGGRAEAKFIDVEINENNGAISFKFSIGDTIEDNCTVNVGDLVNVINADTEEIEIEIGEKYIRIWDGPIKQPGSNVLEWFSTEKLLWDKSYGRKGIEGLDQYRELATYDLLYVGIAKKTDSFDRLLKRGHKNRMDILANEPQRFPGARPTDETFIFLFDINVLQVNTYESEHIFEDEDIFPQIDEKRVTADAEKAFVSLLDPKYNSEKYKNYPKGSDGLYGAGFARYCYLIGESLTFNTACGSFKGHRGQFNEPYSNEADITMVEGDDVKLFVPGVDFPSDV
ncbi:hypothetical protein [Sneathiella sp. HT1-7]|uniref:hypothetical protein n=1 Tax=Sneathiella sp. HT1-7 TaxID=2887192 RepID=UPI001D13CC86|nr:hypothetical protein [Sneathiella sp. HT1-7]MCC3303372.1 hypothetical protein [Sneathiella sp. HT1-7]